MLRGVVLSELMAALVPMERQRGSRTFQELPSCALYRQCDAAIRAEFVTGLLLVRSQASTELVASNRVRIRGFVSGRNHQGPLDRMGNGNRNVKVYRACRTDDPKLIS